MRDIDIRHTGAVANAVNRLRDEDEGMTTAEYAVGTVAVAGLGGVLFKLLTSDSMRELIWQLLQQALSAFLGN